MNIKDIGNGICVVENLFDIDPKITIEYINFLRKMEQGTFTYFEENGKKFAINRTGFKFDLESISLAPERFIDPLCNWYEEKPTQEQKQIVITLEDLVYKALIEYCKLYPAAATVCWWRYSGHFATYRNGQGIGQHCDDNIPYQEHMGSINEFPKHVKVSMNIYMNNNVEKEEDLDGTNFIGGLIRFKHASYVHKPKMGTAVICPANYIGTHEVTPVLKGTRVAYLVSFCYGNPENSTDNDNRIWMPNLRKDCNLIN